MKERRDETLLSEELRSQIGESIGHPAVACELAEAGGALPARRSCEELVVDETVGGRGGKKRSEEGPVIELPLMDVEEGEMVGEHGGGVAGRGSGGGRKGGNKRFFDADEDVVLSLEPIRQCSAGLNRRRG